jgi:hypothetical protein
MGNTDYILNLRLIWGKIAGCYLEFGTFETVRRSVRELLRKLRRPREGLDISLLSDNLAIGAAPKSLHSIRQLRDWGFNYVIDLREERKQSDILAKTKELCVQCVPFYDDWRPLSKLIFKELADTIKDTLIPKNANKLLICCGAGEHRAPLAGVLALVIMGHSIDTAISLIIKSRSKAELLPVYMKSLRQYLASNATIEPNKEYSF